MYDPDDFPNYAKNAEDENINYKTAIRGLLKNAFWAFYLAFTSMMFQFDSVREYISIRRNLRLFFIVVFFDNCFIQLLFL